MNSTSLKRLSKVHPLLAEKVRGLAETLRGAGIEIEVVQGLRTFAEQNELYRQGRSKPGPIVTRAKGGQSMHNYGIAVDVAPVKNGKIDWNDIDSFNLIGFAAKQRDLEWGGDWKKFIDKPHVQLPAPSIAKLRKLFDKGGLPEVWKGVTALSQKPAGVNHPSQPGDSVGGESLDTTAGETPALPAEPVRDDGTQTNDEISGAVSEPDAKEVKMTTMSTASKRLSVSLVGAAILGFLKEAWQTSREQVIDAGQYALAHLPMTLLIIGLAVLGVWIYNTASKRRDERLKQIVEITSNKDKNDVVIT